MRAKPRLLGVHSRRHATAMPLLALNTVLPQSLRVKYHLLVGALPIGLMLGALALPWALSSRLDDTLGLPLQGPLLQRPGELLLMVALILAALLLMLLGYSLGWVFNALISRHLLGWSPEQVRAVYLRSEVPAHWLKPGAGDVADADARSIAEWETQRQGGAWRFVALRGVLAWGVPMFLMVYLVPTLFKAQPISPASLLAYAGLWAAGGAVFGVVMWRSGESNYRKLMDRRPR